MSEMLMAKSKIKGKIDLSILSQTLAAVAKKEKGEIIDSVADYYGNQTAVKAGIKTSSVRRGIGVNINQEGEMEFAGDSYGCSNAFKKLQAEIESTYTLMCLVAALKQEGVQIEKLNEQNGNFTIEGWI